MKFELKIRNIVLIGSFNPIAYDRYFFVKNEIVTDEQITEKCVFLPQMVQLVTPRIHLVINPLQLVLNSVSSEDKTDELAAVLLRFMATAKDVIVTGSGMNFKWFLTQGTGAELSEFSRALCFNPSNKIQTTFFDEDDATFGFYSSKNVLECRLKLDVKPIRFKTHEIDEEESALQFEFNFHKDYKEPGNEKKILENILTHYLEYWIESEKMIGIVQLK